MPSKLSVKFEITDVRYWPLADMPRPNVRLRADMAIALRNVRSIGCALRRSADGLMNGATVPYDIIVSG
jgi:hypothetical protein